MNESSEALPKDASLDALDDLPLAYVEIDLHGTVVRANRLTRSLHSSHAGELIGKQVWELMPADEQQLSRAAFTSVIESGEDPTPVRRSIFTNSGEFRVHELHRNLIRDAAGRPAGMRVISMDVTEAHKAQSAADRACQWLESILKSMAEAVVVTDALGFIRFVNPAAEALVAWKGHELIGKQIAEELPTHDCLPANPACANPACAGIACADPEALCRNKSLHTSTRWIATIFDQRGDKLRVEISASPVMNNSSGAIEGVVNVMRRIENS